MNEFFSWLICCLVALIGFFFILAVAGKVYAAPSIERTIEGKKILLNTTPCENGYKAFEIDKDVVKSGCWYNDGKEVVLNLDGVINKYAKQLFELGVKQ